MPDRPDSRTILAEQDQPMMRSRAIAIAAEQKVRESRMLFAAGLLLLPLLLLLLISP